jgi:hypothetical protein
MDLSLLILWHIDPLLSNDHNTSNETTTVARQRPACNIESTVGGSVFYVVRSEAISRDRPSSVSAVQCSAVELSVFVGEQLVRGLLRFSPCESLLLETGN